MGVNEENHPELRPRVPLFAWIVIGLTAIIAALLSRYRPFWYDEFLVIWTDSVPSIAQLIHIQRAWPISLDPLVYHSVIHCCIRFLGPRAILLRLRSLIGFLVMQLCLFIFVDRVANRSAALIAMAYPAFTMAFFFSIEVRPYGMMLGFVGIATVLWQSAIRAVGNRLLVLITLACAIGITLNLHYYGVLLLVPLFGAEACRSLRRRQIDWPLVASMLIGACGILFALPFVKAASQFSIHSPFSSSWHLLVDAYVKLLPVGEPSQNGIVLLLCVIALFVLWAVTWRTRRPVPSPELLFLLLLAAIPIFGYLLGVYVAHGFVYRHAIEGVMGLATLFAIPLGSLFYRGRSPVPVFACLVLGLTALGTFYILRDYGRCKARFASLSVSPELKANLLNNSDGRIYYQDIHEFAVAYYYETDPELKSRMVLLYSPQQEIRWLRRDTDSLTAIHLKNFQQIPSKTFEEVLSQPGTHVIVTFPNDTDNDWTAQAFEERHALVTPMFPALGGIVESVRTDSR